MIAARTTPAFERIFAMPEEIELLLAAARRATPSAAEREAQRRSFAYGNTALENALITRDMVDRQAERSARERE
jgi:hypothetical protein